MIEGGVELIRQYMNQPMDYFKGERKSEILEWMDQINSPILILQGKPVLLYRANFEFLIPEMKKLGKDISSLSYPDMIHGFYWGKTKSGATPASTAGIMEDMGAFIKKHIK